MKAALIVVDMLNDFFDRSPALATQRPQLVANTNRLVHWFRSTGLPVLWVRQEFAPDLHDAFLEVRMKQTSITIAGTSGCELLPELQCLSTDPVIVKKRYSAFFGTDLERQLSNIRPAIVVLVGVNTHACVRMTAIDAYQRDYNVVVPSDCVASSDSQHHDVTLRYLNDHVARVIPTADVLNLLEPGAN